MKIHHEWRKQTGGGEAEGGKGEKGLDVSGGHGKSVKRGMTAKNAGIERSTQDGQEEIVERRKSRGGGERKRGDRGNGVGGKSLYTKASTGEGDSGKEMGLERKITKGLSG